MGSDNTNPLITYSYLAMVVFSFLATPIITFAANCFQTPPSVPWIVPSSIDISLLSEIHTSTPDSLLGITATVRNNNVYSVKDGILYIRVLKDATLTDPERFIDSFIAAPGIDLAPGAIATSTFAWRVPADAVDARYQLQAFFVSSRSPFLPPPTRQASTTLDLVIKSNAAGAVFIDPQDIEINGLISPTPTHPIEFVPGERTSVTVHALNTTSVPYEGTLTWRLYQTGSSPLSEPLIASTQTVRLHPHSSTTISYVTPRLDKPTYYIRAKLTKNGTSQSFVGIWLRQKQSCTEGIFGSNGWARIFKLSAVGIVVLLITISGWAQLRKQHNKAKHFQDLQH